MSQQGGDGARVEYNEYTKKACTKSMSALKCRPIGRVDGGADLKGVGAFADAQIGPGCIACARAGSSVTLRGAQ
jgi:hypothetical protein